ncbi:MAG: hypothetical protein RSA12_09710, partial [Clostridia bacterium]
MKNQGAFSARCALSDGKMDKKRAIQHGRALPISRRGFFIRIYRALPWEPLNKSRGAGGCISAISALQIP